LFSAQAEHSNVVAGYSTQLAPGEPPRLSMPLEDRLSVRCIPDPGDRRGTLIQLTDKGFNVVEAAVEAHVANMHRLLSSLEQAEQQSLAQLLRKLLIVFEE